MYDTVLFMKVVSIYTDGSCDTQSGKGAWAFLLRFEADDGVHELLRSSYVANTTNNRMELSAAIYALQSLSEACAVEIFTDSQYLKKAFSDGWLQQWQKNGWKTAAKKEVKNKDLWLELLAQSQHHNILWQWLKGHAGHRYNELVDGWALQARRLERGDESRRFIPHRT